MKFPLGLTVGLSSSCAFVAWAGTAVALGHPVAGAVHPAASAKLARHKPATNTKLREGRPRTAPPEGPYEGVDRQNPVAVGKAFLRASYTFDTGTQASTNPATVRSTIWCTPSLRARMLAELPHGSPGGQWIDWTAHKAVTAVAVDWAPESGAPPDTTDAAQESYDVTVTPHGEHGWTGEPDYYVWWVTLSRTGPKTPWEVASFEVQPWFPSSSGK